MFSESQHTEGQGCASLTLAAEPGSVSHSGAAGFEGVKGSWRPTEACHCAEGLEFLKRAQERLLVKVQPSCSKGLTPRSFGDVSAVG